MQQVPGFPVTPGIPVTPKEFSGDLRSLPQLARGASHQQPRPLMPGVLTQRQSAPSLAAPFVQTQAPSSNMPSSAGFAGLNFASNGSGWPPDPNGDVGPNHYIQAVNTSIGIFNKSGSLLTAFTFDSFWSGANTGTACDNNNQGDPIALYDPLADRWIFADFAWASSTGPFYECFGVSKTGDPVSGGWWRYAIRTDDTNHPWMADYPKLGIWPDGIYMSANMFNSSGIFQGVRVWAFNRSQMESGTALQSYLVDVGGSYASLLPSNLRGSLPPSGTPDYFVSLDPGSWALDVWKFHVDWTTLANSSFTRSALVSISSYTDASNTNIPEQGGESLDSLGDRLMMQNQYRNIGGAESLWLSQTVGINGVTGIRWYQLNVTGGTISSSPVQSSTYQPDGNYRWMPSLAVDKMGNMAVGYSLSSSSMYPAIAYSGRLATDPLNTLGQAQAILISGTGAQSGDINHPTGGRWGDYSSMTVDPLDDCTFWYTNEYYSVTGYNWQTQIGSFKFPSCGSTISGNVGVGGVTLSYTDGTAKTVTSANDGSYSLSVSYNWSGTVTPSKTCYTFNPLSITYSNVTTNQTAQNYTYSITTGCIPTAGTYDDPDAGWTYTGSWTALSSMTGPYNGTDHRTNDLSATASFTFTGTGFVYYYVTHTSRGQIGVWVDGTLIKTINANGTLKWQSTYVSPILAAGTHTVVFKNASTSTSYYIDADALTIIP